MQAAEAVRSSFRRGRERGCGNNAGHGGHFLQFRPQSASRGCGCLSGLLVAVVVRPAVAQLAVLVRVLSTGMTCRLSMLLILGLLLGLLLAFGSAPITVSWTAQDVAAAEALFSVVAVPQVYFAAGVITR